MLVDPISTNRKLPSAESCAPGVVDWYRVGAPVTASVAVEFVVFAT
jgi:hypothetical protein